MAICGDNFLFIHMPKTGGMWITCVLKYLTGNAYLLGAKHDSFPNLLIYGDPPFFEEKYTFVFVRHPIYWYMSRWAFRLKIDGWDMVHRLDYDCASNDFNQFVRNIHEKYPNGWFDTEKKYFVDNVPRLDFVGRTEFLRQDMKKVLKDINVVDYCDVVDESVAVNDSDLDGMKSYDFAKYTRETMDMVLNSNEQFINKYYSDFELDEQSLLI